MLASSGRHPAEYCIGISVLAYETPEEQAKSVRSDITYYETPSRGAVFAAGSMCWATSLPHNDCDNNVSRITANVLRHFLWSSATFMQTTQPDIRSTARTSSSASSGMFQAEVGQPGVDAVSDASDLHVCPAGTRRIHRNGLRGIEGALLPRACSR